MAVFHHTCRIHVNGQLDIGKLDRECVKLHAPNLEFVDEKKFRARDASGNLIMGNDTVALLCEVCYLNGNLNWQCGVNLTLRGIFSVRPCIFFLGTSGLTLNRATKYGCLAIVGNGLCCKAKRTPLLNQPSTRPSASSLWTEQRPML
jgi:hypothetical protein